MNTDDDKKGPTATDNTKKMIEEFTAGFNKSLKREKDDLAKAPKVHDVSKGEHLTEVDPKVADKFLDD